LFHKWKSSMCSHACLKEQTVSFPTLLVLVVNIVWNLALPLWLPSLFYGQLLVWMIWCFTGYHYLIVQRLDFENPVVLSSSLFPLHLFHPHQGHWGGDTRRWHWTDFGSWLTLESENHKAVLFSNNHLSLGISTHHRKWWWPKVWKTRLLLSVSIWIFYLPPSVSVPSYWCLWWSYVLPRYWKKSLTSWKGDQLESLVIVGWGHLDSEGESCVGEAACHGFPSQAFLQSLLPPHLSFLLWESFLFV